MQGAPYLTIPVTAGDTIVYTKVSPEHYEALAAHRWYLGNGYAIRNAPGYRRGQKREPQIRMAREILGLKQGDPLEADHRNGDKLDNRRENLRAIVGPENGRNRRAIPGTASAFRGVSWVKRDQRWKAAAGYKRKQYRLGYFTDERAAAAAVNRFWVERGYPAPNDLAA